jgi:hypothetical protein
LEFGRVGWTIGTECGWSSGVKEEELWIGLVNVKPLPQAPGALNGAAGAFVNIITWATDLATFKAKAETVAATYDVYVVEIENAESVSLRKSKFTVDDEIEELILQAEGNEDYILCGTFHEYPHETA